MKRICCAKRWWWRIFDGDGVEGVALGWWRIFIFLEHGFGKCEKSLKSMWKILKKYIDSIVTLSAVEGYWKDTTRKFLLRIFILVIFGC